MKGRDSMAAAFAVLFLYVSSAMAQDADLRQARRAVLDGASKQVSVLQSVVGKVPAEAQGSITDAIKAQEEGRNKALEALGRAQTGQTSKEEGIARAYEAVNEGTQKHLDVLRDLRDKVPPEARPAIERAWRESQTGRNTALSTLSTIKQGQIPPAPSRAAERSEGYGPPDRPGKPEGARVFGGSERKEGPPFGGSPSGFGRPSFPGGGGGSGSPPGGLPGGGRPGR